ncbi:sugar phosphate isomerase/epimerase family protein [Leadbettera azotonutricia]|uniref:Xylose isomerase domain protein TIM barrel n=1 Tax=Leadbettera azotonutricia (strain ATCC BAA-888 / DSM 13862 / ZAS-9) TaxID=545695 RepID=F5YF03_LEAAZ|nr:sugar phosphate isomerase/epimerase family protein [Leadbettera azotonutricia]AEF81131.1 xylose isomerase domain protein TIM barrel [Leadbettera azotonutricia ZAS-9]
MYKGFSSGMLGFGGRKIEEDIPLAVKYGYGGIIIDIVEESKKDPAQFNDLLAKNKLKNGGFGLPVEFRQSEEKFEEGLKKFPACCEFAQKTGALRCITWLSPASDTLDYKSNFELHKTRLAKAAKILENHGIRFGLEFVGPPSSRKGKKYEFIHNLATLDELLDAIGASNMGYLMDVYHWDLAGQSYKDFKKIPGKEWVVMAHINDAPAGLAPEDQQDLERELPGATGVLKIGDFMKGLQDLKYDGPVYVEPFYKPFKTMAFEDALKMSTAAMDKIWTKWE